MYIHARAESEPSYSRVCLQWKNQFDQTCYNYALFSVFTYIHVFAQTQYGAEHTFEHSSSSQHESWWLQNLILYTVNTSLVGVVYFVFICK